MYKQILSIALTSVALSFTASAQNYPQGSLLAQFLYGQGSNCQVITESSNTYHQMYVNGIFKGNYQIGYQDAQLENMLYRYVSGGVCRLPNQGGFPPGNGPGHGGPGHGGPGNGGFPPHPPGQGGPGNGGFPGNSRSLTQQFMNNGSVNCSVIIENSRTYHQVYVNGEFKGNYLLGAQDAQLENMLYRYVSGGVCRMRY